MSRSEPRTLSVDFGHVMVTSLGVLQTDLTVVM